MRHVRPSRWRQLVDKHPRLPNVLAVAGIVVAMGLIMIVLLLVSAARIKGVG